MGLDFEWFWLTYEQMVMVMAAYWKTSADIERPWMHLAQFRSNGEEKYIFPSFWAETSIFDYSTYGIVKIRRFMQKEGVRGYCYFLIVVVGWWIEQTSATVERIAGEWIAIIEEWRIDNGWDCRFE